jgi:hypothetical protein
MAGIRAVMGKSGMSCVVNSQVILTVFMQYDFYETFQLDRGLRVEHFGL